MVINKTKKTYANAVTQIVAIGVQSIFSLFVVRAVIESVGSDYNGINASATQVLTLLTLIEGGFTLAALVKMYKPYGEGDLKQVNAYLTESSKKFRIIGGAYLFSGIVLAFCYAPFVKTDAPLFVVVGIIILSVISSAFSIYYVSKYRLLFQVSQSEYLVYIIQTVFYTLMYTSEIIVVKTTHNIILTRMCVTVFQVLTGFAIGILAKKEFPFMSFKEYGIKVQIEGVRDVFVGKISGLVFSSAPIFFISTFISTIVASIYAVYNGVYSIISNIINAALIAPRNALGQIMNDGNMKRASLSAIYDEYEWTSGFIISVLFSTSFALTIPFVNMYTNDVADVNYIDKTLATLFVLNSVFQMIHIPSGTCIEVSGHFKAVKIIQTVAAVLIIVTSVIGALKWGVYGIMVAKLITSILLTILEVYYTRTRILKSPILDFFKNVMPALIVATAISVFEYNLLEDIQFTVVRFLLYGSVILVVNLIIVSSVCILFNRKAFIAMKNRVATITRRRR